MPHADASADYAEGRKAACRETTPALYRKLIDLTKILFIPANPEGHAHGTATQTANALSSPAAAKASARQLP